jgi:hypothetical protein
MLRQAYEEGPILKSSVTQRDGPLQGELGSFELSSRLPHDGAASKPAN